MRIIGGSHKGRQFLQSVSRLPVRPTTDFAKEALFNIINNNFDFTEIKVLDLFSGTGSISYEFASRGSSYIIALDNNNDCCKFINETAKKFNFPIRVFNSDVFNFIEKTQDKFDLIFADPPYNSNYFYSIADNIFSKNILNKNGWLIIEHPKEISFTKKPAFIQHRKYGNVNFSFFQLIQ